MKEKKMILWECDFFFNWKDEGKNLRGAFKLRQNMRKGAVYGEGEGSEGMKQKTACAKYWSKERLGMFKELGKDLGA